MNPREMIERALGKAMILRFGWAKTGMVSVRNVADALAEQAIVIECEVEHMYLGGDEITAVITETPGKCKSWFIGANGHRGTPGGAIAIIVPDSVSMEGEDETH